MRVWNFWISDFWRGLIVTAFFTGAIFVLGSREVFAQSQSVVDYGNDVIIDSDLDGLTDKGEEQIFHTDIRNPDTDGDGWLDGAEVIGKSDPLDALSPNTPQDLLQSVQNVSEPHPIAWYISRASGGLAFFFLWVSMFLGLSIRNHWIRTWVEPVYKLEMHKFTAISAILWTIVHAGSLLFDSYIGFTFRDISVPFASDSATVSPPMMAIGIISFYLILIVTVSAYLRSKMPYPLFRFIHFLNVAIFVLIFFHGLLLGTDMGVSVVFWTFVIANGLLLLLYVTTIPSIIANLRVTRPSSPVPVSGESSQLVSSESSESTE